MACEASSTTLRSFASLQREKESATFSRHLRAASVILTRQSAKNLLTTRTSETLFNSSVALTFVTLSVRGPKKHFDFWGKEKSRSDMHSYDSNSPSGACFDASNGSQPRLADGVKK